MTTPAQATFDESRLAVPGRWQLPAARAGHPLLKVAPVIVLVLALMMPVEVRLNISGQVFYAYRLAWLLFTPFVLYRLLRGALVLKVNDLLVVAASGWMVLSFIMIYGFSQGIPSGLGLALDILVPYMIVRLSISDLNDVRRVLVVLAPAVFLIAILLPLEAFLHQRFIREAAQAIFGALGVADYGTEISHRMAVDTRFGLLRAMGPFSHPIMAGLFFCSLLPLYYFSKLRSWPPLLGMAAAIGSVFSLSSAAILGLLIFAIIAIYDWLQRVVSFLTWPLFFYSSMATATVIHFLADKGLIGVVIRYTMNPASGHYRMRIWEYGSLSVANHPWFGIGFARYEALDWMGRSVDTYWLFVAVRNGLPPALFLGFATALAILGIFAATLRARGADRATMMGLGTTLLVMFVLGFTVSFFGGLVIWFAILLALCTNFARFRRPRMLPPAAIMSPAHP